MKWWNRALLSPNSDGGNGNTNTSDFQRQLSDLQSKYDKLLQDHSDLSDRYAKLSIDHDARDKELAKTNKLLEKSNAELGGYKSTEARKAKISELLETSDFKGKISLDHDKAMKYLAKGQFNPESLDAEVREAIDLFGTELSRTTDLSNRGAGSNNSQTSEKSNMSSDPLGAALMG